MYRSLLEQAIRYSLEFLENISSRAVAPDSKAIQNLRALDEAVPDGPTDPAEMLHFLHDVGSPAATASAGGRYFGFVQGGTIPPALAAHWLASAWDQNVVMRVLSPIGAAITDVTASWLRDLLRLPPEVHCSFVTGTTAGNIAALAAARHHVLTKAGWDIEGDGLFGAPVVPVIVGAEGHASIFKSFGILGLGRKRVISAPVDSQGRIDPDKFPELTEPAIICLQAGHVDTGAFDPLEEICLRAKESGSWVHIDGAFGLWAAASDEKRRLLKGHDLADSWSTDCHKWLNVPYDSGLVFVRDREALSRSLAMRGDYLVNDIRGDAMDGTLEMSQRARSVDVWAAIKSLGRSGLNELIDRCCRHARSFAEGLSAAGFEILNDVVLNQVLVSFGSDEQTLETIKRIQQDGTCWCGGTKKQGRAAMRISVSGWATTDDDVQMSLEAMIRAAREIGVRGN